MARKYVRRAERAKRTLVCADCGKEFVTSAYNKYRCDECVRLKKLAASKARLQAKREAEGWTPKVRKAVKAQGVCATCGKPFEYSPCHPRTYCSRACHTEAMKKGSRRKAAVTDNGQAVRCLDLCDPWIDGRLPESVTRNALWC